MRYPAVVIASVLVGMFGVPAWGQVSKILIPMDDRQTDHLKAYGVAYTVLSQGVEVDWLLNYRGGAFMFDYDERLAALCSERGVLSEPLSGARSAEVYSDVQREDVNMDIVRLETVPRIAIYAPPNFQPWDDAVTMAMEYAEIPYEKIWDEEVMAGDLGKYDWLHLHHEDFTGQHGKFYATHRFEQWYQEGVALLEGTAASLGFSKVSKLKLAIARKIREFVAGGGFLFAMCSATDTYDIALAAADTDICAEVYDGDPADPDMQQKLDYSQTLAFENFHVVEDPYRYEYSTIDVEPSIYSRAETDRFTLFEFSARHDPVPSMLTQCHVAVIPGFLGQTTSYHREFIRGNVTVLAEREGTDEVKYITGNLGRGTFTFYGGHDPEDYQHAIGDPPTDLALHPDSPGYRLILNNVLFPSAKKKKQKK